MAEMPQWFPALVPAESNKERPIREMVGAIVRGPMNFINRPMRPVNPTSTWNRDPTIIEP